MKHSLINPNHILFNVLDFFENIICDDELYIEMDDELNVPVQFKEIKCIFLSRVSTCAKLDTLRQFYMISHNEWNPYSVNICDLRKYLKYIKMT